MERIGSIFSKAGNELFVVFAKGDVATFTFYEMSKEKFESEFPLGNVFDLYFFLRAERVALGYKALDGATKIIYSGDEKSEKALRFIQEVINFLD